MKPPIGDRCVLLKYVQKRQPFEHTKTSGPDLQCRFRKSNEAEHFIGNSYGGGYTRSLIGHEEQTENSNKRNL